jgi:hypothetical protein
MNTDPQNPTPQPPEAPQPVAYDAQGRPLYAHPPVQHPATPQQTTVVHVARPLEPEKQEVSPKAKQRHNESKRIYPTLNLSDGEYIIRAVRRHPIGLFIPLFIGTILLALTLIILFNYAEIAERAALTGPLADPGLVTIPLGLFALLVGIGMYVVYYVYVHNKFFLTNESVIQEIQHSLFSRLEQTVSLSSIEDASYTQHGIIQALFNYGDIRLSTEGDETTYRFTYVANPKEHIAELNDAVEAFKNGRPVGED